MTKNDTCKRLLTAAAVLLAAAAMLHTLFVGLEIEEEYALSLASALCGATGCSIRCGSRTSFQPCPPRC